MGEQDAEFDPTKFQMSVGDHLEELRRRILRGLGGLAVGAVICLALGQRVVTVFCRPLVDTLQKYDISPQLYTNQLTDAFMVYTKISLIAAAALASPWIVYQLWLFVSAGLYPRERKYITRYIPLSIVLLMGGMVFVYFLVLPVTLDFFVQFTAGVPLSLEARPGAMQPTTQPSYVQAVRGDPEHALENQIWFDTTQDRLKMFAQGKVRVIPFGPDNLIAMHFTLPDYVDLVLQLLLTFGLAFQLPLVVMALARVGIVSLEQLRKWRSYVYVALATIAAILAPGDVVTATIALMIPLVLLYELGIFLAKMGGEHPAAE
jgi:sec-independent protein translocase protein TatC